MKHLLACLAFVLFFSGCCSQCVEPSVCVPSGTIEVDTRTREILSVTGPSTLLNPETGQEFKVPDGYTYFPRRSVMEYTPCTRSQV